MTHAHTQLNAWLAEIHPALQLDDQGACVIAADNNRDLELFATPQGDRFFLSTAIMPLPADSNRGFFLKILAMNLFMQDTRGAALACDEQAGELVLCYSQTLADGDATQFRNVMENFAQTAKKINDQLAQMQTAATPASAAHFAGYNAAPPQQAAFENINPMTHIGRLV